MIVKTSQSKTTAFLVGGIVFGSIFLSLFWYYQREISIDPEFYYTDEYISQVKSPSTCVEGDDRDFCDPSNATRIYIDCEYQFTQAPDNWGGEVYTKEMLYHNTKKCESLGQYIDSEIDIETARKISDPNIDIFVRINFIPYEDFKNNIGKSKITIFYISNKKEGPYEGYGSVYTTGDGIELWGGYWYSSIFDIKQQIQEYKEDMK